MIREPSAELRVAIREYLDQVILPEQNYSCSECLEPLGEDFVVQLEWDDFERSHALCHRCGAAVPTPGWSWQMPNLPSEQP